MLSAKDKMQVSETLIVFLGFHYDAKCAGYCRATCETNC